MSTKGPCQAVEVAIVGGGPVGLTLGMDLASRGVDVVIIEQSQIDTPEVPKTNHVSARSMEIFRRLGIADDLRAVGLPAEFPQDVAYYTTLSGNELTRIPIPSVSERRNPADPPRGLDALWPTPEPAHRVNQMFMEPILASHARTTPGLTIVEGVRVEGVMDSDERALVRGTDVTNGKERTFSAVYVVGCDGSHSLVRREMGASLAGDSYIQRYQQTYIRAPQILDMFRGRPAWNTHFVNPRRSGSMIAIDGESEWIMIIPLDESEKEMGELARDTAIRAMLGVGMEFKYEVLKTLDWTGRRLVSTKFRSGRLFVCGDAAHSWIPFAGYGMNAGLADAAGLGWLLAAAVKGWGHGNIVDAYECERRPVTEQVSSFVMSVAVEIMNARDTIPECLEEDTGKGKKAREKLASSLYELGAGQYCSGGLNFGYYYDQSPIIIYDGAEHPGYSMSSFVQSTVPGCRTPHVWLRDGSSLYDKLGAGYTLLRLDPAVDVRGLVAAATNLGIPLDIFDLETAEPVYDRKLVLSRPDRHVAWRGDELPKDLVQMVEFLRGAGSEDPGFGSGVPS